MLQQKKKRKKVPFLLIRFKNVDQDRIEMNSWNTLELPLPSTTPPVWHHSASSPSEMFVLSSQLSDGKSFISTSDAKLSHFKFPLGAPAFFHKELQNQDATEGDDITLRCELSKPGVRVEWRKGGVVLGPGKKFQMRQDGCVQELCIQNLEPEDSGYYTCDAGDQLTTASLAVQGSQSQYFYICPGVYFRLISLILTVFYDSSYK